MNLREKLNNFLTSEALHTILINGKWGVGKTYQVDKWKEGYINFQDKQLERISKKEKNNFKQYYFINLSLFGINDINDLVSNAYNEMHRVSKDIIERIKIADIKAGFNIGGISTVNFSLSNVICEIIKCIRKENPNKIYVFIIDDIERKDFKLSIPELFGFVDSLNKTNTKVILIANEEEIGKDQMSQGFLGFKEKVVQREYLIKGTDENAKIDILGKETYELLKDELIHQDNLRTLKTLSLIESNSNISGNQLLLKGVYYCLQNIYEGLYTKEQYTQHLFDEKKSFEIYYTGSKSWNDEKIKKEVENEIQKIENDENIFFVKNIESKYLLTEIENDSLYDFLNHIYKAVKSGNYEDIQNAPIILKPDSVPIKIDFNQIYKSDDPLNKYYEFLDNVKSSITNRILNKANLFVNYFTVKTSFRKYFSEYYSINTKREELVEKTLFNPLVKELLESMLNNKYVNLEEKFRFEPLCEDTNKYISNVNNAILNEYKTMLHESGGIIDYSQLRNFRDLALRTMGKKKDEFYKFIDIDKLLDKQILLLNEMFKKQIEDEKCFDCVRLINELAEEKNVNIHQTKKRITTLANGTQINNIRFKMLFDKIIKNA